MFEHVFQKQWELVFSHEARYCYRLTYATPIHTQTRPSQHKNAPLSTQVHILVG